MVCTYISHVSVKTEAPHKWRCKHQKKYLDRLGVFKESLITQDETGSVFSPPFSPKNLKAKKKLKSKKKLKQKISKIQYFANYNQILSLQKAHYLIDFSSKLVQTEVFLPN